MTCGGPNRPSSTGSAEPRGAASRKMADVEEDGPEQQAEDGDADEREQTSRCHRVALVAAEEAPQEGNRLHVGRRVLCRDLLGEEGALLCERPLRHVRDERDERRRVGRYPQRVVDSARPDAEAEEAGQERQHRVAKDDVDLDACPQRADRRPGVLHRGLDESGAYDPSSARARSTSAASLRARSSALRTASTHARCRPSSAAGGAGRVVLMQPLDQLPDPVSNVDRRFDYPERGRHRGVPKRRASFHVITRSSFALRLLPVRPPLTRRGRALGLELRPSNGSGSTGGRGADDARRP